MAEALICTQCGSHKLINISENRYVCDSCGTTTDFSLYNDEISIKLNHAMTIRQTARFDEAKVLYEEVSKLVKPDQCVPETYFGLFVCDYKVLFELDNRTGNRVPIFYSSSETSVFDNKYLKKALEQAKEISETKYQEYYELANKVESARALYQKLIKYVPAFDIFICFKKTDLDNVSETRDYSAAMSLYQNLVNRFSDFRIFFSEKTLAEIPLTEYEPNIYYALHTSKILIVVSSKRDYLESQWVKNEWSRFLAINSSNAIIPIYLKGTNVNIFPTEILKNNAYEEGDYERIFKAIDVILNSEKNIKQREEEDEKRRKQLLEEVERRLSKSFAGANVNIANLFKRLVNDLADGEFDSAQKHCDNILNIDAEQPLAWFYSLLIEKKLTSLNQIHTLYESDWVEHRAVRKALEFSELPGYEDDQVKLQDILHKWIKHIVSEAMELRDRKKYADAKSKLVKVATHVEKYGKDQRFYYFYTTFLLELDCVQTDDIVSIKGFENNFNFTKALYYASDLQKKHLNEIIDQARKNAEQYNDKIIENNVLLKVSLDKLNTVEKAKIDELKVHIDSLTIHEENLKNDISQKNNAYNNAMKQAQEELHDVEERIEKLKQKHNSKSEKLLRFLFNVRAVVFATAFYSLIIAFFPESIVLTPKYIAYIFGIMIVLNFINMTFAKKDRVGGFVILGILTGIFFFELPLLLGYRRRSYRKRKNKQIYKLEAIISTIEENLTYKQGLIDKDVVQLKRQINLNQEQVSRVNQNIETVKEKANVLRKENPILSLEDGIFLKVQLEKKLNLFKESIAKLDEEIYKIARIRV